MGEPVFRAGSWWFQRADGAWLRRDEEAGAWTPHDGPPPPPSGRFRDLSARRRWAVGSLVLVVAVDAIAVLSGMTEYSLLGRIAKGLPVTISEAGASDTRQAQLGLAQAASALLAGVAFIVWFHAARTNLSALGASGQRFGPGWAIGGWFVPILNLWRPKQIANDIWRGSAPGAPPDQSLSWRGQPIAPLLTWWWAAWIATTATYWAAVRYDIALTDPSIADLRTASAVRITGDALNVVAGVLAILVVKRITERQLCRASTLGLAQEPSSAGGSAAPA